MQNTLLSDQELERYRKHIHLPWVGLKGQASLKQAKVLCVGVGGLGSSALYYLAAAGVGTIGLLDHDQVELSNLQRQILYQTTDVGQLKVLAAKRQLLALNEHLHIITHPVYLSVENAERILSFYDIVVDCSDNYATRYLVNDCCVYLNKPFVYASLFESIGQCAFFDSTQGPCFRCLFREAPKVGVPNCTQTGVLGALPGLLGTIQATEVLKYFLHQGDLLLGRLLRVDVLTMTFNILKFEKDQTCSCCVSHTVMPHLTETISADELKNKLKLNEPIFLLDVRTHAERSIAHIGGLHIPLALLPTTLHQLNKTDPIVVYCQAGVRSLEAVALLKQHGFQSVRSLVGGLKAMGRHIILEG